jgi:hypothetical protein
VIPRVVVGLLERGGGSLLQHVLVFCIICFPARAMLGEVKKATTAFAAFEGGHCVTTLWEQWAAVMFVGRVATKLAVRRSHTAAATAVDVVGAWARSVGGVFRAGDRSGH